MKKNTILEFFNGISGKITNCFLPKNTLSKLDLTKSNERSSIDFLLRLSSGYWHKSLRLSLMLGAIMMMGYTVTAQSIKGVVPVQYPIDGSGVDGDAWAHEPTGTNSIYLNVGDLFDRLFFKAVKLTQILVNLILFILLIMVYLMKMEVLFPRDRLLPQCQSLIS